MPSTAPADGADKGTGAYESCTGGAMGVGKDPYVGSFPSPTPMGDDAAAITGGEGDKTGGGKGSKGPNE